MTTTTGETQKGQGHVTGIMIDGEGETGIEIETGIETETGKKAKMMMTDINLEGK